MDVLLSVLIFVPFGAGILATAFEEMWTSQFYTDGRGKIMGILSSRLPSIAKRNKIGQTTESTTEETTETKTTLVSPSASKLPPSSESSLSADIGVTDDPNAAESSAAAVTVFPAPKSLTA